jgi:hypothetical protein
MAGKQQVFSVSAGSFCMPDFGQASLIGKLLILEPRETVNENFRKTGITAARRRVLALRRSTLTIIRRFPHH